MATVKLAAPLQGIRGHIGRWCWSENRSSKYVSQMCFPRSSRTESQHSWANHFGATAALWKSLTGAEQADWDTLAATPPENDHDPWGNIIFLTGFQWFNRIQSRRHSCGLDPLLTPPTDSKPSAPTSFSAAVTPGVGGTLFYDVDPDEIPVGGFSVVFLSPALSLGRVSSLPNKRLLDWQPKGVSGHFEATSQFTSLYGILPRSASYNFSYLVQTTQGIRSNILSYSLQVS